jgi:hypothetical protein
MTHSAPPTPDVVTATSGPDMIACGGQNPAKTINGLEAGDTSTGTDFGFS